MTPPCFFCPRSPRPGDRCATCGRVEEVPLDAPHVCHARRCLKPVRPELLMCAGHWRRVPNPIREAVWAAYRPGQCDDGRPSLVWLEAASAAVGYVAQLEKLPTTPSERAALEAFRERLSTVHKRGHLTGNPTRAERDMAGAIVKTGDPFFLVRQTRGGDIVRAGVLLEGMRQRGWVVLDEKRWSLTDLGEATFRAKSSP